MILEKTVGDNSLAKLLRKRCNYKNIAVARANGGVGKTTTSVGLADSLAQHGARVLLVDFDPQSNLTYWIGRKGDDRPQTTIASILANPLKKNKADPEAFQSCIGPSVIPGIDLAYGNFGEVNELALAVQLFSQNPNPAKGLEHALQSIDLDAYHYVIIDCPPSAGYLQVMALVVADHIVVPVNSQTLGRFGLDQLVETLRLLVEAQLIPLD